MSALSLRLPDSLHHAAREAAQKDGISINQLIASALGEKLAALHTEEFLAQRGRGASEGDWDKVLAMIPDAPPEARDRFPDKD